jgi:hypothetical protein
VQWVNRALEIWRKDGTSVYGPVPGNTLFAGFGGPCEATNHGQPSALYDALAGRWFLSQFALPNSSSGPFYQCIAISQTSDPTGAFYRYQFLVDDVLRNDYSKFGVWPDAYYMSVNNRACAVACPPAGAGAFALERDKMLVGQPARMVSFSPLGINETMLPSDLDGTTPPPAGAPGYFAAIDTATGGALQVWKFHVDWADTAASTFSPSSVIPVAPYDTVVCEQVYGSCVPQPEITPWLDAVSDRLMYRLAYRNFGSHESLVLNHTVNASLAPIPSSQAGIRWYELRVVGSGSPALYQQGTFAPADGHHRWMGSIAMDRLGNIALGYSVSSKTVYPSIRFTARLDGDPLGQMTVSEGTIVAGSGVQDESSGWGRSSMMTVDPTDDCTFWYTNEYIAQSGPMSWQTRIGSFRLPGCAPAGDFSLGVSPSSRTVKTGGVTTYNTTVTPMNGFAGSVSFSVNGLPPGATGSFDPPAVTSGTSALTVKTSNSTPAGTFALSITGSAGATSHSVPATLVVKSTGK